MNPNETQHKVSNQEAIIIVQSEAVYDQTSQYNINAPQPVKRVRNILLRSNSNKGDFSIYTDVDDDTLRVSDNNQKKRLLSEELKVPSIDKVAFNRNKMRRRIPLVAIKAQDLGLLNGITENGKVVKCAKKLKF
jgi:hypothetical protein